MLRHLNARVENEVIEGIVRRKGERRSAVKE